MCTIYYTVHDRKGRSGSPLTDRCGRTLRQRQAVDAFRRYGKGNHPARLNFGDCMTYAAAKLSGEPLLFGGDDFPLTDVND